MNNANANHDDRFHVIGLTSSQIVTGVLMQMMNMPLKALEEASELVTRYGPPARTTGRAMVGEHWAEVYSASPFANEPRNGGRSYQIVLYLNDVAVETCRKYGLAMPKEIESITRDNLPPDKGILLQFPVFYLKT